MRHSLTTPVRAIRRAGTAELERDAVDTGFIAVDRPDVMDRLHASGPIRTFAVLGNHTPRRCGIATFTADLSGALRAVAPELRGLVVAMNDAGKQYAYPEHVSIQVAEADIESYHDAADFLHLHGVDVLSVQHEYGIFGGQAGAHVLALLRDLRMPIVTTLHTILAQPSVAQRAVMDELCTLSERLVVMSANGAELLGRVHRVPREKIDLIPHGIPALPATVQSRAELGLNGKRVLLTFGLLSPDKGIQHVIDALPAIAARHPDIVYIVLGTTHPHIKEQHGEAYRAMLEGRGRRLGVGHNLVFHDRFVSTAELVQYLAAADVYITPYLNSEQITSGTLAYAVGAGKAVISSPYRYARELLADGRGVLVPWKDSAAIATQVVGLLGDGRRRRQLERRAAAYGRSMGWPAVARRYMEAFQRAAAGHAARAGSSSFCAAAGTRPSAQQFVDLAHNLPNPHPTE